MSSRWILVVTAGIVLVLASCSSTHAKPQAGSVTTTTSRTSASTGDVLEIREVLGQLPYGGRADSTSKTCEGGRLVTAFSARTADVNAILPDRAKTACYALGPTLLNGQHIGTVSIAMNQTTSAWEVNVDFDNDDFVTKIAGPYVGRQIAIVVDGIVESAPTINQGITGREVTISGAFDEATARRVAQAIAPPGSSVQVTPSP